MAAYENLKSIKWNQTSMLYEFPEDRYIYHLDFVMLNDLKSYANKNRNNSAHDWYKLLTKEDRKRVIRTDLGGNEKEHSYDDMW